MEKVVILSAQRTAIGTFQGAFAQTAAPKLGATAISAAMKKAALDPNEIQECIMGHVLQAGTGQAPARQAAIYAGLPNSTVCMAINKVCGSGLKAVMLGTDSIAVGNSQVVIAGGQENMTLAPHLLESSRAGYRMGNFQVNDSMLRDGLWDPYNNWHMGNAAELCVKEHHFSREAQDQFAIESYTRAQNAQAQGWFSDEICAVEVADKKGTISITKDEEPTKAIFDKIPGLKPAFDKTGTITAANASKINDGAAALVLASESWAKQKGKKPIARVVAQATFAQDPKWFTTAPVGAMKSALQKASLKVSDIDLWEINEAFSVVTMVAAKDLEIPMSKINVNGGAVALGHPIGASGARILTTLVHALRARGKKYGMASLCIGGGEGVALIVEALT